MGKRKDIDLEWEDDEDYSPTGYERRSDESDEEIEVFAEVDDARSTIINESMVFDLDENTKEILITVQAEKGNTNIYKITVIKNK